MNAEEIKKRRKLLGLTQKELAQLLGVSFQTVNGYENGKEIPTTKYQLLDTILSNKNIQELNEPQEIYGELTGIDKKINQLIDRLNEINNILELLPKEKKHDKIHYIELKKLLQEQILLYKIAKKDKENNAE